MLLLCMRACLAHHSKLESAPLNPIVGMVVTTSPSFNMYSIVVLPEASRPKNRQRCSSALPKSAASARDMTLPDAMLQAGERWAAS